MSNYLPYREADLKAFALNFAGLIVAAPDTYALLAADATVINSAVQDFVTQYDLVQNPSTRTSPNVAAKNAAKEEMIAILRGYAMQVKTNRAVTDAAKVALGLGLYDWVRTATAAPTSHPIISVVASGTRQHDLRFRDELTPQTRARPAGVRGLQLFCQVAATPPATPSGGDYMAFVTRSALKVDFGPADVGKTAYYFARWQTATGLVGPWGVMASRMIAE